MESVWDNVKKCADDLDAHSPVSPEQRVFVQVVKLTEEVGEVAQALIGATGSSPRKGFYATWEDVQAEVCDVILTGMVTLARMGVDPQSVFEQHLAKVSARPLAPQPQN